MRKKLVIGNWKMHGSLAGNESLLRALRSGTAELNGRVEVGVCVPYPYLHQARQELADSCVVLGAQNVSPFAQGAYTGEVSVGMLKDFGCRQVIVGHSERRSLFGERDEDVAAKTLAVLGSGLVPVVCVGETLEQREAGNAEQVVRGQLDAVLRQLEQDQLKRLVIAYEPVWAIGTGRNASPEQAQDMHAAIRTHAAECCADAASTMPILYGGSVKADNAGALFSKPDIDGGLIGGAALVAESFLSICLAAAETK
ncbi:MAG: triose-phosphate isomerase [Zoogloea sp.]|nr:triose-phosphate isomerase [Zoogloea sp.]